MFDLCYSYWLFRKRSSSELKSSFNPHIYLTSHMPNILWMKTCFQCLQLTERKKKKHLKYSTATFSSAPVTLNNPQASLSGVFYWDYFPLNKILPVRTVDSEVCGLSRARSKCFDCSCIYLKQHGLKLCAHGKQNPVQSRTKLAHMVKIQTQINGGNC